MATRKQRRARRGIAIIGKLDEMLTQRIMTRLRDARVFGEQPTTLKPGEDHMAEANALVNGDRQVSYGSPFQSYTAQAKIWSGMLADKLRTDLTAEDVVLLLAAMKLRRQAHKPKRDNVVDVHGYALVLAHVEAARERGEGTDIADMKDIDLSTRPSSTRSRTR